MKKILILVTQLNRGGIELSLLEMVRQMRKFRAEKSGEKSGDKSGEKSAEKWHIDILLNRSDFGELADEFLELDCNIYNISPISALDPFTKKNNQHKELIKFLSSQKDKFGNYDIIHSHLEEKSAFILDVIQSHTELSPKTAFVIQSHNFYIPKLNTPKSLVRQLLAYKVQKQITKFKEMKNDIVKPVSVSKKAGDWLFGNIGNNSNDDKLGYRIIRNPINTHKFKFNADLREEVREELCSKYNIHKNTFILGAVGRFNDQKNFDFLIKVMNHIDLNEHNIHLVICGSSNGFDKSLETLQRVVIKYHLQKNITIIQDYPEIPLVYNAFDLFLIPSKHEGFGNVFVEAISNGLSVITSENVPASDDYLHHNSINNSTEQTIEIIPADTKTLKVWASKIIELMHSKGSHYRAEAINTAYLSKFNPTEVYKEILDVYFAKSFC